jgi:hypothetical protein
MEEVKDGYEKGFSHEHVALRRVLLATDFLPFLRALEIVACQKLALRRISVQLGRSEVSTLDCVGMNHLELTMVEHSSATLLCMNIVTIFGVHSFFGIDAVKVLEIRAIVLQHLAENLSLNLL